MSDSIEGLSSSIITKYLLNTTGCGQEALGRKLFPDQSDPRKKIQRWLAGEGISNINRKAILKGFPETKCFFDLPLFKLLGTRTLNIKEIEQLLSPYKKPEPIGTYWKLPRDSFLTPFPEIPIIGRQNTQALAESSSVEAFTIILGLIMIERLTPTKDSSISRINKSATLSHSLTQAARAFPSIARHPLFNNDWKKIYTSFKQFVMESLQDPTTMILDDEIMEFFINMDTDYILIRGAYGRHPNSHRLITLSAPVIYTKRG